ncbi:MAG: sensor histidine kinase, partial [Rhizomicrobium sp.]
LFRVLQESLTNIHRHSGATEASIRFLREHGRIELYVSDNGHGLPPEKFQQLSESDRGSGVGIAGMRERLRQLGGQLAVQSNGNGTTISVTLSDASPAEAKRASNVSAA